MRSGFPSSRSNGPLGEWISRAKAAKFSDASATPRPRSSSIARATMNSVRPFGVSSSRRMKLSETASRP